MIGDLEERIIYERDGLLVVNKPFDMPSSGRTLADDDCLQYWLIQRHGGMVWAVHQLDADTTGINLFVTEKRLVKVYKKLMESPEAEKRYLVLVYGEPVWDEVEEFGAIGKIDEHSLGICESGKSAHSRFEVLRRGEGFSFVEARIFTGRTHQIRIHLAHLGHPLVGEEWYRQPACLIHKRQALHCRDVYLPQIKLRLQAEMPPDLKCLMLDLGLKP